MNVKLVLWFIFVVLMSLEGVAQLSFLGVAFHHAKAYKLNSGYEPPTPYNGILLSTWQAKQLNWIMSSTESYDLSGANRQDCSLYDKVIFYDENHFVVATLSLGLDCGKFKLTSSVGTRAVANRLNEGGSDALFELLSEAYVKLNPVLPKNVKTVKHTVKEGDTWVSIAEKYQTTAELVWVANKKMPQEKPRIGITVKVYQGLKYYSYPGTKPSPPLLSPAGGTSTELTHTVAPKETLYSISKKYNVSVASIQKLNGLADNSIKIGLVLKIPK